MYTEQAVEWAGQDLIVAFLDEGAGLWGRINQYPGLTEQGADEQTVLDALQARFEHLWATDPDALEALR